MRFILRIGVLLIGICVLGMSVSVAVARRESPQLQLAMTVLTTNYYQNDLQYDLFLVHAESGFRRRVTHGNGMPDYVEWTDDGKWLSFYEAATYGSGQFLRLDWQGHHQQTVASEGSWFSRQAPSSPNGQWKVWIGLDRTLYLYNRGVCINHAKTPLI